MLKSFADKDSENLFHGIYTHSIRKRIPLNVLITARRRLDILNIIHTPETLLQLPAIQPEAAVRDCHGKYSIPLDGNWRIAFRWNGENAEDVEIRS